MMEGPRVFVQVICATLVVVELAAAQLEMGVLYPDSGNRSHVWLRCMRSNGSNMGLPGAQFSRNGSLLTAEDVTSLTDAGNGEVTFIFTQAQEGFFRCVHEGQMSPEIGLAGNSGCVV